jgi:hypothetical protein
LADERALDLFEGNTLSGIFGAVQDKGQWRRRYNFEIYKLYDEPELVKYININRLKWAEHVMRMNNDRITKAGLEGKSGTGLGDSVVHDVRILGEMNWRNSAQNKEERWKILKKARVNARL